MRLSRSTAITTSLGATALAFAAGLLAACAAPTAATTTTTAADVGNVPAGAAGDSRDLIADEEREGQLVCRTHSLSDGTTELYLDWKGDVAKGALRHEAPSGMVTIQKVRAERYKNMIVADDTLSTDLAVHAATIREVDGKRFVRLGDWKQAWRACL